MARIISIDRHDVAVIVGKSHDPCTESPVAVTLLQGICRSHRMDILIQKSTELGVSEIQPIHCERSVAKIAGQPGAKKTRTLARRRDQRLRAMWPQPDPGDRSAR